MWSCGIISVYLYAKLFANSGALDACVRRLARVFVDPPTEIKKQIQVNGNSSLGRAQIYHLISINARAQGPLAMGQRPEARGQGPGARGGAPGGPEAANNVAARGGGARRPARLMANERARASG